MNQATECDATEPAALPNAVPIEVIPVAAVNWSLSDADVKSSTVSKAELLDSVLLFCVYLKMSVPVPPDMMSTPAPPTRMSFPAPPSSRSEPAPPLSVSSPPNPTRISLPLLPEIVSPLPVPTNVSLVALPFKPARKSGRSAFVVPSAVYLTTEPLLAVTASSASPKPNTNPCQVEVDRSNVLLAVDPAPTSPSRKSCSSLRKV